MFRLHDRRLPGKPDLVFPRYSAVLFAHGCFWHGHNCHLFRLPATRTDFWAAKIDRNRQVDQRSEEALRTLSIRTGIVWECSLKRSEEHTSELQSLMRISYAVFCLKKKKNK